MKTCKKSLGAVKVSLSSITMTTVFSPFKFYGGGGRYDS